MPAFVPKKWSVGDFAANNDGAISRKIWATPDNQYTFFIHEISNGVALGSPSILGTFRDGVLHWFLESNDHLSFDNQYESIINQVATWDIRQIDMPGDWCVLNSPWVGNFYHWILECLTKVYFLESSGYRGNYIVPQGQFIPESMRLLGVSEDRLKIAGEHRDFSYWYRFERLFVCDRFHGVIDIGRAKNLARDIRDKIIRDHGLKTARDRKIYIARDHYRVVQNADEVLNTAEKHGFERVYMEKLSLLDQIALVVQSRIILGPNGAGLTHALFMPDNSTLIELVSPHYSNACFFSLANAHTNRYYMISSVANRETVDIVVPINVLDALLTSLETI